GMNPDGISPPRRNGGSPALDCVDPNGNSIGSPYQNQDRNRTSRILEVSPARPRGPGWCLGCNANLGSSAGRRSAPPCRQEQGLSEIIRDPLRASNVDRAPHRSLDPLSPSP